jgi:hypothetical protein
MAGNRIFDRFQNEEMIIMQEIIHDELSTDILVIGAGFPGVCAAITAARSGCSVILAEKERVLGGNSGPNCGVWPSGAHRYHPFAANTGIAGEIFERAYNHAQPWESILSDMLNEAGVCVLRCHYARRPVVEDQRIQAVIFEDTGAYRTRLIKVGVAVVESSGDGHIAAKAGAAFMKGREGHDTFGERKAPDMADNLTMGASLVAIVRKTDRDVKFAPPPDTPAFLPGYGEFLEGWPETAQNRTIALFHPSETGGERDIIADDAAIYETALKQIYSAWNYVKNIAYPEVSRCWELQRISPILAKRESRRFVGDYILKQQDLEEGTVFPDAVAIGGFAIDIHMPRPETPEYIKIVSYSIPPLYTIPYRSLYARDIENLFFASRLLSASHIAHGSIRVGATLGGAAQAVGIAAGLCRKYGCTPRKIYTAHLAELHQNLLKEDASFPGVKNEDPNDLALSAIITATSESRFGVPTFSGFLPLDCPRGVMLWDWGPSLDIAQFFVKNILSYPQTLHIQLLLHESPQKYNNTVVTQDDEHNSRKFSYWKNSNSVEWGVDDRTALFRKIAEVQAVLQPDSEGWVEFPFYCSLIPKDPCSDENRYILLMDRCNGAALGYSDQYFDFVRRVELQEPTQFSSSPESHAFTLVPSPPYGEATLVTNGINRRFSTNPINMWRPEPELPQSICLRWTQPLSIGSLQVTFDTLLRAATDGGIAPQCVRDYLIEAEINGMWRTVHEETDNYHRFRRHVFAPIKAAALRLTLLSVWEKGTRPGVYEIRVYPPV